MSVSNDDFNHRLIAAEAIAENHVITYNSQGKAANCTGAGATGIAPQPYVQGERVGVVRKGTISGLSGFSAGARLRCQGDSTLGTAGTNPVLAIVKAEDATTALILSANLDQGV